MNDLVLQALLFLSIVGTLVYGIRIPLYAIGRIGHVSAPENILAALSIATLVLTALALGRG